VLCKEFDCGDSKRWKDFEEMVINEESMEQIEDGYRKVYLYGI
jgi:hypothetical protein